MTKIEVDAEDFGFDVDLSPEAYVARQQKKTPALAQVKVEIIEGDGDEGGLGVAPVNIFDADYKPFEEESISRMTDEEAKEKIISRGGVELLHKPVEGIHFDHTGGLSKFDSPAPGVYNLVEPSDADAYTPEELGLSPEVSEVSEEIVKKQAKAEAFGGLSALATKLLADMSPAMHLPSEFIIEGVDLSNNFERTGAPTGNIEQSTEESEEIIAQGINNSLKGCFGGATKPFSDPNFKQIPIDCLLGSDESTEVLMKAYRQRKTMQNLLQRKLQIDATVDLYIDTLKGPVETAKLPTSLPGGSLLKTILEEVKDRLTANKTIERAIIRELNAVLDDTDKLSLLFEQKSAVWHDTDEQAIAYILEFFRD